MRGFFYLSVTVMATFITHSLAIPVPIIVDPGDKSDLIISEHNTINGTRVPTNPKPNSNPLRISLQNNLGGNTPYYAYVTGKDASGAVVMLSTDGTWYYPNPGGSNVPVAVQANVDLQLSSGGLTEFVVPDYIISARLWVAQGNRLHFFSVVDASGATQLVEPAFVNRLDPSASTRYGFVEFTNTAEGGIYANLSYIDFVGLVMGMSLTLGSGEVQTVAGLTQGSLDGICADLRAQTARDGQPWDDMCVGDENGGTMRILSPNIYLSLPENLGGMASYYDEYIDQVWGKYTNEDLIIDTQGAAGQVPCRVSGDTLQCQGDEMGFPRPSVADIMGCSSGTFSNTGSDLHKAIVARLCAAFNRSTLLLHGGKIQPGLSKDSYYVQSPTNHYSRIVHEHETDGKGYAFSYDDVNPSGENEAGVVAGMDPQLLHITIG